MFRNRHDAIYGRREFSETITAGIRRRRRVSVSRAFLRSRRYEPPPERRVC